jgi:glycine/D-amino acid oxidase-like deaminating enzyme
VTEVDYDVVIVGGAAMGASTAYHLLRAEPAMKVAVVERDPTYRHASTVLSDGNVRVQFNLEENIRMSLHTLDVLETFDDDMETPTFRPEVSAKHQGNLFLTDEEHRSQALVGLERQRALGGDVAWLDAGEIAAAFPAYASTGLVGGTLGPRDGSVDPNAVLRGYRAKSIELGAEFVAAEAAALLAHGDEVAGVGLGNDDTLTAPVVVNAAGAWAARLAATVGVDLPVQPVMRTVYVVASTVAAEGHPSVFLPSGLYAIPESGSMWLMAWSLPDDPVGFDFTPAGRQRFLDLVWPELVAHLPAFDQLHVERAWAGLYAVNTLDGNAIVGEWPLLRGLFLANGFSGHGFQHCPAVGRYLAELILGVPPSLDLSRMGPQRILDGMPLYEHAGRII